MTTSGSFGTQQCLDKAIRFRCGPSVDPGVEVDPLARGQALKVGDNLTISH